MTAGAGGQGSAGAIARGYASVALDVDSTVSGVEGIDWLAALRGADVGARIAALTDRAMRGEIPLEAVYGERLALIRPTRAEIAALADAYIAAIAPGCANAIRRLHDAGVRVVLVSGGIRGAIEPVARAIGVPDDDLHAVTVSFTADGEYAGYDTTSPLTTQTGKRTVLEALQLPHPMLAVGDGATDALMRPPADEFAAFTGFVTRPSVVAAADFEVRTFGEL